MKVVLEPIIDLPAVIDREVVQRFKWYEVRVVGKEDIVAELVLQHDDLCLELQTIARIDYLPPR